MSISSDAALATDAPARFHRGRRLRRTPALRRLVRETRLDPASLILPLFVRSGANLRTPVGSMPGVAQTSVDEMLRDAERAASLGVGGVLLFGIPDAKDAVGSSGWDAHGPVQAAVRALKREFPSSSSSRTCACASTPTTATAACSPPTGAWTTTRRSSCSPARRCRTPRRGPTW
jgi:delta-aminolevulinic acid dehydratase/porphobilinogen synthase